mgnify:CR=1 FL=1
METVLTEQLGGEADSPVLEACRRGGRILVTHDLDFADTRAYPLAGLPGIWILRPARRSVPRTLALLSRALQLIVAETPQHRLWIIDDARVRIRE